MLVPSQPGAVLPGAGGSVLLAQPTPELGGLRQGNAPARAQQSQQERLPPPPHGAVPGGTCGSPGSRGVAGEGRGPPAPTCLRATHSSSFEVLLLELKQ